MIANVIAKLSARAYIVSAIVVIVVWLAISEAFTPLWLPTIPEVINEGYDLISSGAISVLGVTGLTLVIGLAAVFIISGIVSAAMAASRLVEETLLPFVNAFLATPHIALIPMFTFIWGGGDLTRIVTTVSFAFSPVVLTWTAALKAPPEDLSEMATAFGADTIARARFVRLPHAVAPLISGARIGVVQGIKGVISAEVLIGVVGIGKLIAVATSTFDIAELYAIVLIIIILSVVSYLVLTAVENHMTRWAA